MIYELREYKMTLSGSGEFLARFEEMLIPMMKNCGFTFIGSWRTYIGTGSHSDFVWILQWENLAAREQAFDALNLQPGFAEYSAANAQHMVSVTNRFLRPLSFSPLQ